MTYLKNPFCKFKLHFDIDFNKKQNIISASFFKMSKPYKDFSVYIDGLQTMIQFVENNLPDFKIRLFVDKTILDDEKIKKILFENDTVQIVEYMCPEFLDKDNYHHVGTFGTMTRLFPLFDFDNNDAGHVMIWDIDLTTYDMNVLKKSYDYIIKNNIIYHFVYYGYDNIFKYNITKYKYSIPQAGRLLNSKRFPQKYIINFINVIDTIEITHPLHVLSKKNVDKDARIRYGIDEFFLTSLIEKLINNKDYDFGFIKEFALSYVFYFPKKNLEKNPKSKYYLKQILGKYYNANKSIKDNLSELDNTLYKIESSTPKIEYVANNTHKILNELVKNHNYKWIPKEILLNFAKYYRGIKYDLSIFDNVKNKKFTIEQIDITIDEKVARGGYYNKYVKYKRKYLELKYK